MGYTFNIGDVGAQNVFSYYENSFLKRIKNLFVKYTCKTYSVLFPT